MPPATSAVPRASRVTALILAAGRSSRLGRPKQLLPLAGRPVLAHVLDHVRAAGLTDVVLVLGHRADEIQAALGERLRGVRVVHNPDYAAGQSTSLIAGLDAAAADAAAIIVLLGDQPEVDAAVIRTIVDAYYATPAPIVMPTYGDTPANPVLIDRALFPELRTITGDRGAREVIRAHRTAIHHVPIPDRLPPRDIDTDADYRALLAAWPDNE